MILHGPQMCPHCGYNLRREVPLIAGRFAYYPDQGFFVDGKHLPEMGMIAQHVLGTLMAARGRIMSVESVSERSGSQSRTIEGDSDNRGSVPPLLVKARRIIREMGVEVPFEGLRGRGHGGYRWIGPTVREMDETDFPPGTTEAPPWPPPHFEAPPKPPVLNLCG